MKIDTNTTYYNHVKKEICILPGNSIFNYKIYMALNFLQINWIKIEFSIEATCSINMDSQWLSQSLSFSIHVHLFSFSNQYQKVVFCLVDYFGQFTFVLCLPTFAPSKKARRLRDSFSLFFSFPLTSMYEIEFSPYMCLHINWSIWLCV